MAVQFKELKQWEQTLLVMEELSREVTVEELNTISNVFGKRWARDRRIEWLKVELKREITVLTAIQNAIFLVLKDRDISKNRVLKLEKWLHSIDELFLEMKKLSRLKLLNDKIMEIDS